MDKQDVTQQILDKAVQWIEVVDNITQNEMPLLIQETLSFSSVVHGWGMGVFIVLTFIALLLLLCGAKQVMRNEDGVLVCIGGILMVFSCPFAIYHAYQWYMIQYAPRLYLINELTSLLN